MASHSAKQEPNNAKTGMYRDPLPPPARGAGRRPRLLLAEDDPTSRHFFVETLQQLGCRVEACADGAAALSLSERYRFDLLILDCRMPHAGAERIVERLRRMHSWPSCSAPVVATSAGIDPPQACRLRRLGFADVLDKPLSRSRLEQCLQTVLGIPAQASLIDEASALASCGDPATVHALRTLFVAELERLQTEWQTPPSAAALCERLHRLRASCGFCGAQALSAHALRLSQQIPGRHTLPAGALESFLATVRATHHALSKA